MTDGSPIIETDQDPMIGARIGSYIVDSLIGEGGMGRVYRAHHAHLVRREYALKVLLGDFSAIPTMRIRFAQEAEHASRLSHRNIVTVHDFGRTDGGLLYLAMELVEGTSLGELILGNGMQPGRAIALARQLCEGLAHAHDMGLVHRDFKPDNVIVVKTPEGEVPKIVDFGLALATDFDAARVTSTGVVMGTPGYVAPEQCMTNVDVDHRADLYALGATMFEMLSGGFLPFDGSPPEIIGRKVSHRAPRLATRTTGLPDGLLVVVDRLLERRPKDRFQDARAVIATLDLIECAPAEQPLWPERSAWIGGREVNTPAPLQDDTVTDAVEPEESRERPNYVTGQRTEITRSRRTRIGLFVVGGVAVAAIALVVALLARSQARETVAANEGTENTDSTAKAATKGDSTASPDSTLKADTTPKKRDATATDSTTIAESATKADSTKADSTKADSTKSAANANSTKADSTKADATNDSTNADSTKADSTKVARLDPPPTTRRTPRAESRSKRRPSKVVAEAPARVVKAEAPPVAEPPVVVPPPVAPVQLQPELLRPSIGEVVVTGGLPKATVQRAIDRVAPAVRACRSDGPGVVEVRFKIGESRRASGTVARGLSPRVSQCVAAAFGGLRTEAASDVGDVEVQLRVAFRSGG
jgi:serine/threonine protein kinase